jgi:signal recognition particle subunit SRP68
MTEVDNTVPTTETEQPKYEIVETGQKLPLSLEMLVKIREKQLQNGLRLQIPDYNRYRKYCATRLRRLRKKIDIRHAKKNTKFTPVALEAERIRARPDVRFLVIVLFQAERAWAASMHLKQSNNDKDDSRVKLHSIGRLSKAVQWSETLERLSKEVADDRTQLEAQAYNAWLNGNLLLEREQWQEALAKFGKAKTIYTSLGDIITTAARRELYRQRVDEIEPAIRFCRHSLGGEDSDIITELDSTVNPALDMIKSKLESVLEEARTKQAQSMEHVEWSGRRVPVDNDKIRLAIINSEELRKEIVNAKTYESKLRVYDKLFMTNNEAMRVVKESIKKVQGNDTAVANLRFLHAYIAYNLLQRTLDRNIMMVTNMVARLAESKKRNATGKSNTTPGDVVRLYDTLLQNVEDMEQLPGVDDDETIVKQLKAKEALFKAHKIFYLAQGYEYNGKWKEAFVLYERAAELMKAAKVPVTGVDGLVTSDQISEQIRKGKLIAQAQDVLSKKTTKNEEEAPATTEVSFSMQLITNLESTN